MAYKYRVFRTRQVQEEYGVESALSADAAVEKVKGISLGAYLLKSSAGEWDYTVERDKEAPVELTYGQLLDFLQGLLNTIAFHLDCFPSDMKGEDGAILLTNGSQCVGYQYLRKNIDTLLNSL